MKKEVTKKVYAEAALFAFPNLKRKLEDVNEAIINKAFGSSNNVKDPMAQCTEVVVLQMTKDIITELYKKLRSVFKSFTDEELDILTYRYFKGTPCARTTEVLSRNRNYFRQQSVLLDKFSARLNKVGLNNEWFLSELAFKFMKQYIDKVAEYRQRIGMTENELRKSINPRGFCVYGQKTQENFVDAKN
jgi:hypothetical protein